MIRDLAQKYYLLQNCNCAEAMLHIADEFCGFGLSEDDYKLVGAFGGGMGCGMCCGVLCGSLAALGRIVITKSAHETDGFRELCGEYVESFRKEFGHTDCAVLKPVWFKEDGKRCIEIIRKNTDLFERFLNDRGIEKERIEE